MPFLEGFHTVVLAAFALMAPAAVAEEFYVVFRTPDPQRAAEEAQARQPEAAAEARSAAVISQLKQEAQVSQAEALRLLKRQRRVRFESFWLSNRIFVRCDASQRDCDRLKQRLRRLPGVVGIEPEKEYPLIEPIEKRPAPPVQQAVEWGVQMIKAPDVWALGVRGKGITVATIDTGLDISHPAVAKGWRQQAGWKDPTQTCTSAPCDNNGHGTHVTGSILGDDGQGNQIGVAPEAQTIACKGCASASCASSTLLTCAQWVLDPFEDGSGRARAHVVNNSWGGAGGDQWFRDTVRGWVAAGLFPAFANGNRGPGCTTASSPGDYPESFAVGAVDRNSAIAGFSSRGPSSTDGAVKPNLAAPGVEIRSSIPGGQYAAWNGTSMATPHVAGAVALLWSGVPAALGRVAETRRAMEDTARRQVLRLCNETGDIPNNAYGFGILDAKAAYDKLRGAPPPPPPPEPPTLTILGPLPRFWCPVEVPFQGRSLDKQDGDISDKIVWYDGNFAFYRARVGYRQYSCAAADLGVRDIRAEVVNSAGKTAKAAMQILVEKLADGVKITSPGDGASAPCGQKFQARASFSGGTLYWYLDGHFFWSGEPADVLLPCDGAPHNLRAVAPGFGEAAITVLPAVVPPAPPAAVQRKSR